MGYIIHKSSYRKDKKSKISFRLSLSELREAVANAEERLKELVEKGIISYAGMSTKGGESQDRFSLLLWSLHVVN